MRLLDLFCGAGGAAMGYHRAGFEVVGVDINPQPNYPFEFIQADCLALDPDFVAGFDAIHASPPCQAHTRLNQMWNAKRHRDLIPETRTLLNAAGRPWVMENVPGSPLRNVTILCGTMFRLGSGDAELWRHRLFETSFAPLLTPPCRHRERPRVIGVYGGHGRDRRRTVNTQDYSVAERREAMGIDWMTGTELSQAIPPAYTEFLGRHLIDFINSAQPTPPNCAGSRRSVSSELPHASAAPTFDREVIEALTGEPVHTPQYERESDTCHSEVDSCASVKRSAVQS